MMQPDGCGIWPTGVSQRNRYKPELPDMARRPQSYETPATL